MGHVNDSPCWNSYHSVTHLSVPLVYIDHTLLQNHQIMILFTNDQECSKMFENVPGKSSKGIAIAIKF